MSWFRIDDKLHDHPKWVGIKTAAQARASSRVEARALAKNAGLAWFAAGVWGAGNNCDGIIPEAAADSIAPRAFLTEDEFYDAADLLVEAGLWRKLPKKRGGPGWEVHDWHDYQLSKQQVQLRQDRETRRKALYGTVEGQEILDRVKRRDRERCRYCWVEVDWKDRRSAKRGTIDHVDPDGPNSVDNCVVACGSCNRRKADRTPEAAEMELREPYFGDGRDLSGSGREQFANDSRPVRGRGTGRDRSGPDGPGLVGSGRDGEADAEGVRPDEEPPEHRDHPGEGT